MFYGLGFIPPYHVKGGSFEGGRGGGGARKPAVTLRVVPYDTRTRRAFGLVGLAPGTYTRRFFQLNTECGINGVASVCRSQIVPG
jgi:hypothetical protein